MMAARLPSRALPRSFEAAKAQHRTTLDQAAAARISEPLGRQPSRRARPDADELGTIRSGAHRPRASPERHRCPQRKFMAVTLASSLPSI